MNVLCSGLQILKANKRRVAFLAVLGAGAVSAFSYARRQYGVITSALDAERISGARSLRAVYGASRRTVISTLCALLKPGRERIFACEHADADGLVARLKTSVDGKEKKATWEELKVAAIVRLIVSVYYVVEVYLVLLVQVNLVARYSAVDADAPIQMLEGRVLELESKQQFMSLARRKLFEDGGVEELVDAVHQVTREVVGPVKLTERVGPDDVRNILRQICRKVESKCGVGTRGSSQCDSSADPDDDNRPPVSVISQQILDARWLLTIREEDSRLSAEQDGAADPVVRQLVHEALDVCDVLDYDLLLKTNVDALMDVAGGLVDGYVWGVSGMERGGKVALAPVIAKIANVSKLVLGSEENAQPVHDLSSDSARADMSTVACGPFVDALVQSGSCDAFGAAVFLSGERTSGTAN